MTGIPPSDFYRPLNFEQSKSLKQRASYSSGRHIDSAWASIQEEQKLAALWERKQRLIAMYGRIPKNWMNALTIG